MNIVKKFELRLAAIFALGFANGAALVGEPLVLIVAVPLSVLALSRLK